MEDLRDGFHEQGLGETGSARDQTVSAGHQGDQDLLDDIALADDDLAEFLFDAGAAGDETVHGIVFGRRGGVSEEGKLMGNGNRSSVRHHVKHNVDTQRIGDFSENCWKK